jgi:hypothetical protein
LLLGSDIVNIVKPSDGGVQRCLMLKIIEAKNGKYEHSVEFAETVRDVYAHKPGIVESQRLAPRIAELTASTIVTYRGWFKDKRRTEILITTELMVVKHLNRLNLRDTVDPPTVYAAYYFNDHTLPVSDNLLNLKAS